jgi:hypothetical protein
MSDAFEPSIMVMHYNITVYVPFCLDHVSDDVDDRHDVNTHRNILNKTSVLKVIL